MKRDNKEITIKKVTGKSGEYAAVFRHEFLKCTFMVVFEDSVFGSVGLIRFYDMIKKTFGLENISFKIVDQDIPFKQEELLKMINLRRA